MTVPTQTGKTGRIEASGPWRALIRAVVLAFALCAPMPAAAAANVAYRVEIDAPAPLAGLLKAHLDLVRFEQRTDLGKEQFDYLLATVGEQVSQLAATEGYFSPVTRARVEKAGALQVVHIEVSPGERTRVSDVLLRFTGPIATQEPGRVATLESKWSMPVGQPFRQDDWSKAKDDTLYALQRYRYHAARLTFSQARIEPDEHRAELDAEYDSGPPFTLGKLHVTGTRRYPASIVEHVNPLHEGEPYSVDRLLELQRQIQNTPYFSNVIIDVPSDPAQASLAPVNVKVTEFPTQRVQAGVGYASDTGAHVLGRYGYNNVFGRAWVFSSQANLEQQRQYGLVSLAMPPDAKAYVNSISTSFNRTTVEGVDQRSLQVGLKRARTLDKYDWAYTLDFYRDELRPDTGPRFLNHALVPGFAWTRRNVDDPIFPRRGNIISTQIGFGVKGMLSDQSFGRVYGRVRQYVPIGQRDLMILRTEFGAVLTHGSNDRIPASLLFRAGGNDSIRGYGYQSIGLNQGGSVLPAKYLATGSIEYQHWLSHQWGGAIFWDLGTASDTLQGAKIYNGVGFGVRWRSPVGPVNLDLGYGIERHQFRPNISLGVAF